MSRILFSIRPQFVESILKGEKKYEYRKVECLKRVDTILIYSTSPVMKIVAEAEIQEVIVDSPDKVWMRTKKAAGISHEYYKKYFDGKQKAIAYKFGKIIIYDKPKALSDVGLTHAPQTFAYIE
jgi:predicted transcriptional regulator